jgi:hypothetical protein
LNSLESGREPDKRFYAVQNKVNQPIGRSRLWNQSIQIRAEGGLDIEVLCFTFKKRHKIFLQIFTIKKSGERFPARLLPEGRSNTSIPAKSRRLKMNRSLKTVSQLLLARTREPPPLIKAAG